jgi:hypothetical protein
VRVEWIFYRDRAVAIRAVPLWHLPNLELLLGAAQALIKESGFQQVWQSESRGLLLDLLQKVANLHRRVDVPGVVGFPVWQLEEPEIHRLFFDPGGGLHALNTPTQQPKKKSRNNDQQFLPYAPQDVVDLYLADLTAILGHYSEALTIVQNHDLESVQDIVRRLQDIKRGPEAIEEEELRDWFWEEFWTNEQDLISQIIDEDNKDG